MATAGYPRESRFAYGRSTADVFVPGKITFLDVRDWKTGSPPLPEKGAVVAVSPPGAHCRNQDSAYGGKAIAVQAGRSRPGYGMSARCTDGARSLPHARLRSSVNVSMAAGKDVR